MKNTGLYINTRTSSGNKLYKNGNLLPMIQFLEPEEKEFAKHSKNWRELKDVILFKMQKGELIYGNPMTDKELNQFCKLVFKYLSEI